MGGATIDGFRSRLMPHVNNRLRPTREEFDGQSRHQEEKQERIEA